MEGANVPGGHPAADSLMRWWRDAGVDMLVEDAPRDWLAKRVSSPVAATIAQGRDMQTGPVDPPRVHGLVESLPATLGELLAWMGDSADVPEARWGRTRILPAGDRQAGLMILTDMPEPGDADAGMLMAGDLGALFDKMLKAIGRDRHTIWLAPLASIRPAGGRIPAGDIAFLTRIARHLVSLAAPRRLLIMGDAPNRALLGSDVLPARGQIHSLNLGTCTVEAVATFHPRLLLQRPAFKTQAWKDLQLLMEGL